MATLWGTGDALSARRGGIGNTCLEPVDGVDRGTFALHQVGDGCVDHALSDKRVLAIEPAGRHPDPEMRSTAADFDLCIRDCRAHRVSDPSKDFLRGRADLERHRAQYLGTCGSISVDQASMPPIRL